MLSEKAGTDQVWFWDRHFLKNKKFPYRAVIVDKSSYTDTEFGKLKIHETTNDIREQQFEIHNDELICKWNDLRFGYNATNLAVGCINRNDPDPQTWEIVKGKDVLKAEDFMSLQLYK